MYVKIMCLQEALYKAIKLSVSKTSASRVQPFVCGRQNPFSRLFHRELYQQVIPFVWGGINRLDLCSSLKLMKRFFY